ncbi:MAG: hypothetical protein OHK0011_22610 [Turneriella sp.]
MRLAALELGITVTAFVRLALRLGLRHLAMEKQSRRYVSDTFLFWRAIKRWAHVKLHATNHLTIPDIRRYLYSSFPPEMRWGMILQQAV